MLQLRGWTEPREVEHSVAQICTKRQCAVDASMVPPSYQTMLLWGSPETLKADLICESLEVSVEGLELAITHHLWCQESSSLLVDFDK